MARRAALAVVAAVAALTLCLVAAPADAGPSAAPGPTEWSAPLPGAAPDSPEPPAGTAAPFTYQSGYRLKVFADEPPPDPDDLDELEPRASYEYGTYNDMLAYWRDKGLKRYGKQGWRGFVLGWVQGIDANKIGDGYGAYSLAAAGAHASKGWVFETPPPGAQNGAKPDAHSTDPALNRSLEAKWTGQLTKRSQKQLASLAQNVDTTGAQAVYLFGKKPTKAALELIKQANLGTRINKERALKGWAPVDAIVARRLAGTPQPVPIKDEPLDEALAKLAAAKSASAAPSAGSSAAPSAPPSVNGGAAAGKAGPGPVSPRGGGGVMVPPGSSQVPVTGALDDAVDNSPDSPQDAQVEQSVLADVATATGNDDVAAEKPLGGVDFSSLQLRYVSDTYQGGNGLRYAFSVNPAAGDAPSFGGRLAAKQASDAFFVWLELPPSNFTVNLNPDEPDRIIEARFGSTDAGRILLQADLQMKKTVAKLIQPDTATGKAYWAALQGDTKCLSMRQWIVPKPATVRQDGDQLYILDAPLDVKLESDYVKTKSVGGGAPGCGSQNAADTQHNEAVYRSMILPQIQQAVNNAPEYADLRRVYVSRIAAQWYRERSQRHPTAYSKLIDQGDVRAWPATVSTTPRQIFDQYVQSYTKGEFNVTHTTRHDGVVETQTFVYGGVDLTRVPRDALSGATFGRREPGLPTTVNRSLYAPEDQPGGTMWLGGESTARPLTEIPTVVPPTGSMPFWVLLSSPLALWLFGGALLLVRRRQRRKHMPTVGTTGP